MKYKDFMEELEKNISEPWHPKTKLGTKLYNTNLWDSNLRHYFLHPIEFIKQFFREIKFALQRAFRGWDDTQIWNLDYSVSKNLVGMLTDFKKYNMGIPYSIMNDLHMELHNEEYKPWDSDQNIDPIFDKMASDKWNATIQEMIDGFSEYVQSNDELWSFEEDDKAVKKLQRSLELLSKHYLDLWL